jgi:hypothetical protein
VSDQPGIDTIQTPPVVTRDSALPGPDVAAPPASKTVSLKITNLDTETNCAFWVGLSKPGSINPLALLDDPSVASIFTKAATEGIDETGPVMLSDTERNPPRFVYLLPMPGTEFRDQALWVDDLVATIRAWAPQAVGFYLAPELVDKGLAQATLLMVIKELVVTTPVTNYWLLVGSHGFNTVLNAALNLKEEIDGDQDLQFLVFH